MNPKVSIIIPFYNVEEYLEECLISVANQDYNNIEVIAVNDGSTDSSLQIMESYSQQHNEWKIITISNSGQSTARNTGLENAQGDYILFLDSDDKILPNTVRNCITNIQKDGVNIFLFGGKAFFSEEGMEQHFFNYERKQNTKISGLEFFENSVKHKNFIVQPCMYMYKRETFQDIRFYPGILHEDNLFTTQLLIHQDALISSTKEIHYLRRFRNNSSMTQSKNINHVNGYKTVIQELIKLEDSVDSTRVNRAISKFNDNMIENFIITCFIFFKARIPLTYRKQFILFYFKNKHFNFKNLILSFFPEALFLKKEHMKSTS